MTPPQYEYDVCLSFAGEQRDYVEEVAYHLKAKNIEPFYDKYERANLWGKDLYEHLDEVYRNNARYCILFISDDYARKVWTTHERKSAQARAFSQRQEYILPVRFDDTEIPGLRPTVGYLDARITSPVELANFMCDKLANPDDSAGPLQAKREYVLKRVPLTPGEQELLISTKPPAWEYLLFGGALTQGNAALAAKKRDHQLGHVDEVRSTRDDSEALHLASDMLGRARKTIIQRMMRILDPASQEWAFGAPDSPGDVDNILHLARRFIGAYEEMYNWASNVREVAASPELSHSFDLLSEFMDVPMKQVEQFIEDCAASLSDALDRLDRGEQGIEIALQLTLSIDESLEEQILGELDRIDRALHS